MRHGAGVLALLLVASLGFASAARADGGLFVEVVDVGSALTQAEVVADGRLSSNLQRALYVATGERDWDLYVQPGTMAVAGAAWMLPLPRVPSEVAEDVEGVLDQVDEATRPVLQTRTQRVRLIEHEGGGHGGLCGGSTGTGGGVAAEPVADPVLAAVPPVDAVWVRAAGTLGAVDYEVLSAADADELQAWLTGHGYAAPDDLAARAAPYVQRGWAFFVARVRNDEIEARALPTFRFRLRASDRYMPLTYPMRLTTLSMGAALDFVLLVAGPGSGSEGNFEPAGGFATHRDDLWVAAEEGDHLWAVPGGGGRCPDEPLPARYDANLETLLAGAVHRDSDGIFETSLVRQFAKVLTAADVAARAALADADDTTLDDEATWTVPLAGIVSERLWVTRLRGRATPGTMDADVVLDARGTDAEDDGVFTEYCWVDDETGQQVDAWGGVASLTDGPPDHGRQANSIALLLGATLLGLAARRRV